MGLITLSTSEERVERYSMPCTAYHISEMWEGELFVRASPSDMHQHKEKYQT